MNRFKIKNGGVEIEIESDTEISLDQKEWCLSSLMKLRPAAIDVDNVEPNREISEEQAQVDLPALSINSLISKVGAKTAREVQIAAAVHLVIFDQKQRFSLSEWDARARDANVWRADWTNQKSTNRKRLIDSGVIIENAKDQFTVSPDILAEYKGRIGG